MNTENSPLKTTRSGVALPLREVPVLPLEALHNAVADGVKSQWRVSSLFAFRRDGEDAAHMMAVLADDAASLLRVGMARIEDTRYPSLSNRCPQVHLFEREMHEQFGLVPEGHPWLKPVRYARPFPGREPRAQNAPRIGAADFYHVTGDSVHEVAVGPVHAGVIEPGHFRFQCHGEQVFHLEIMLGYQHRGVEEALPGGPHKRSLSHMETLAGDSSIAHGWAYCMNLEGLAGTDVPMQAQTLRGVALELERLANHTGDLGALAGDVGYLPTMSFCGRIRGDFLNLSAAICGNRFGRGLLCPGGVRSMPNEEETAQMIERLGAAERDVREAVNLIWSTPTVLGRFENTGTVPRKLCVELGLVGPAARACGVEADVRVNHPCGLYERAPIRLRTAHYGDVNSRASVRWHEMEESLAFVREHLDTIPSGPIRQPLGALAPDHVVATLVEGWRGEVCHVALTGSDGRFLRYKITDPSFHNWMGLAVALRGQEISDFPLCNKSFNLSYCGFDL
ncbi:MAG: NADH-quinone oxidoreductase subunit C [Candidatus Hydrogenedentes bacterium]|nr:NADH-quinone oxidoreductase subunit C [Candidatus Hydrogenedentota bacterium]